MCGQEQQKCEQLRILLIEDDPQLAGMICVFCAMREAVVDHVHTCKDAIGIAMPGAYDLALVDMYLSDGDTLPILPDLRSLLGSTEIFTMSGFSQQDLGIAVEDQDIMYHLEKPFGLDELQAVFDRVSRKNSTAIVTDIVVTIGESYAKYCS